MIESPLFWLVSSMVGGLVFLGIAVKAALTTTVTDMLLTGTLLLASIGLTLLLVATYL